MKNKKKNFIYFVFLTAFFILAIFFISNTNASDQDIVVGWDFSKDSVVANLGNKDNLGKEISVVGASIKDYSSSAKAITARDWDNGAESKYWQIEFDSTDYFDLAFSSKQKGSPTGPKDFRVEYKIAENGEWKEISGSNISIDKSTSFKSGTLKSISLPADCDNQESVYLRWIMTSNLRTDTEAADKFVGATGTNYIDDIIISKKSGDDDEDGEDDEEVIYSSKIRLNEILPNPKGKESDEEYIEIYNGENSEIDLEDWILKDSSKSGKFTFPEEEEEKNKSIIKSKDYIAIYRKDFKFAINNSGESIYLLDPNEKVISSITYTGSAKEDRSYGLDDDKWRWSKYLTPDKKNKFSSKIRFDLKEVKSGYANVPIKFGVSVEKKNKAKSKIKYRWDFDDERKSYVKNPSHTFYEPGKYKVSLTVDNGIEEKEDSFSIKIKKYPRYDVEIHSLVPNPSGKDSDNEWVRVKNNDKKEINLKDWKIATGKNLTNHSIKNDIIIRPGEIAKVNRSDAAFSLNNKEGTVRLRYPDKKSSSKIKYKKDKIEDDEICQNMNGICFWYFEKKPSPKKEAASKSIPKEIKIEKEAKETLKFPILKNEKTVFLEVGKIKGRVYKSGNDYKFTPNGIVRPHWAKSIFGNLF